MSRQAFSEAELETLRLPVDSSWFDLFRIPTAAGDREIIRRKREKDDACKVIPLVLKSRKMLGLRGRCSLKRIRKAILRIGVDAFRLPILANDRPSTYFPTVSKVLENWVYELPGGIVHAGEDVTDGGMRELLEELGLRQKNVLCYASLTPHSLPYDAGSHMELTRLAVAIFHGEIAPPKAEGFVPEESRLIRLDKAERWLLKRLRKGYLVDGQAFALLDRLHSVLSGGWRSLRA